MTIGFLGSGLEALERGTKSILKTHSVTLVSCVGSCYSIFVSSI